MTIREISDYRAPTRWKRSDDWRAKAADGSLAWMDMRGFVGLQQPGGLYITLGASVRGASGELHDGKHGPPPKGKPLEVFVGNIRRWQRGGYQTKEEISAELRRAILDSLEGAMRSLGYSIKYVQTKKRG